MWIYYSDSVLLSLLLSLLLSARNEYSEGYCFELRLWFFYLFIYVFIYLFILIFVCYHDNSWKAQPIRTKFSHMTFDWNSSARFENGHRRSHVNSPPPYNKGFLPLLKINIPPISTNPNQIFTHDFWPE